MNFTQHILSSLISAARGGARRRYRLAVCVLSAVAAAASLTYFQPRRAQAQQTPTTLHGAAALEQLKQEGQYDSLQEAMNQARFTVSQAARTPLGRAAWHAPNPAAGYDAYVTETGVSIAVNDQAYVSLNLYSLGYGAALRAVGPGEVSGDKQTISLRREGGVREWYVNGPDGLEHGFTLSEPPGARPQGAPLRLALQVSEGWQAVARDDGKAVTLRGAGAAVEYGKLVVSDSLGRNLPARLTVAEEQVVIEAEDSDAAYPLTIDPIFTLQQKLLAADAATYDHFGNAVALSDDTLVVGANGDDIGANASQGSVYVFTRSGATWTLQQKLTAGDGAAKDLFGNAVALDGDTLVVSAHGSDVGANINQGSAYVFTRSGAVWTQQQKLIASDGVAGDLFGVAVSLSGDTLIAGAFGDDIGANVGQGSAYVFTRNGAAWTQQQKLTAGDGAAGDTFGYAVAVDGDTVVVGAYGDDIGANVEQGSVYVFTRNGATWTLQQKLTASDGAAYDIFGVAVALSGDTLAAGASDDDNSANEDDGAIPNQGSAYVFTRSGAAWTQQQKLTAGDGAANDNFGAAVALDGDTLAVGAQLDDVWANADQGSVYVFTRSGAVWTQQQKLTAADGAASDLFGGAVALSGDTLAVGASLDDINANLDQGSVYVFVIPSCPALTFEPPSLPNGVKGISYQQLVTVSGGGAGPYQFALAGGALPPGLSLATSGLLSGTPAKQGTYNFTLTATNLENGCSDSHAYTITVTLSCPALTIDPPTLPNGATGAPYSETLTATGGMGPYNFAVKGKLPPELTLNTNGVLSGTPTKAGNFKFTLVVSDARGCNGSRADSITIVPGNIE